MWKTSICSHLSVSKAVPVRGNLEFQPSVWDSSFKTWANPGLHTIYQVFNGTKLESVNQLQKQFQLPSKDLDGYVCKKLINKCC